MNDYIITNYKKYSKGGNGVQREKSVEYLYRLRS